jgi:hypothetical protein
MWQLIKSLRNKFGTATFNFVLILGPVGLCTWTSICSPKVLFGMLHTVQSPETN